MLGENSAYHPDGVVDVGILVVTLFKNPLRDRAVKFLSDVLSWKKRAAIPVTAVLGAFHVTTRYLKLPAMDVMKVLIKMLETMSPAFYPHIFLEDAIDAIKYARDYKIKSWDGYIIKLAKSIGNNIVYTLDEELSKVKDVVVINPFPQDLVEKYHEYIEGKLRRG